MKSKSGIFISGTDTNVGKTITSALLVSALNLRQEKARYFKPIQTGNDSDTDTVVQLAGLTDAQFSLPTYIFPEPIAPSRAAALHGTRIQIELIRNQWRGLSQGRWIIEGAGGLMVPINSVQTTRDLIKALELSLILVASTRLGTINHTLLTLEVAQSSNIPVAGMVLVGAEDPGLIGTLSDFTDVPILAQIPLLNEINPSIVQTSAEKYFSSASLQILFPEMEPANGK